MLKYKVEDVFRLEDGRRYYVTDVIEDFENRNFYCCIGVDENIELNLTDVAFFEIGQNENGQETLKKLSDTEDRYRRLVALEVADISQEVIPGFSEQLQNILDQESSN